MNILLIVNDTLRSDHLGCCGYFRNTSPVMDRLAREGVLFEQFFASGINTGTAFTGIHTGLYPIHHKVYSKTPPDLTLDEIPTLAEILRANDYTTVAFDNLAHNRHWAKDPVHFYRGFEHYISDISNPKDWSPLADIVRADWYNSRLIPWIQGHSNDKFFAFVHYWDTHQPYTQPESYRKLFRHEKGNFSDLEIKDAPAGYQYVPGWGKLDELFEGYAVVPENRAPGIVPAREASIDLYDGAVAYLDHAIGEVVETLEKENILDDTLIVVTADHGELLGQHGIYSHANLYEGNIRVPLIIRCPSKFTAGSRVQGLAGHVDILPTILDIADISDVPQVDGASLQPLIAGRQLREEIVAEDGGGVRAIRTSDWKLIYYCRDEVFELYNLADDPMEVINLAEEEKDKVKELKKKLDLWIASSLNEGEEDPMEYVKRNHDYRKWYRKFFTDRYWGQSR